MKNHSIPASSVGILLLACLILACSPAPEPKANKGAVQPPSDQVPEPEKKSEKELISEASRAYFDLEATSTPIEDAAIERVFKGKLFSVKVEFRNKTNGHIASDRHWVLHHEGEILPFKEPHEMVELRNLTGLIRDDFRLRTEADAKIFQAMVIRVFQERRGYSQHDIDAREIIKTERGWTFATAEFLERRSGYEVSTDADGVIVGIERSLGIPAKQE